ncbi:MAG TPA: hypothetical protein PLS46_03335 [Microthrixaceae bacterium]|nr:hypothetical protein [Microthrixaceae bacterium]
MSDVVGVDVVICRILGLIHLMGILNSVVLSGVVDRSGHEVGCRADVLGSVGLGGLRIGWALVGTRFGDELARKPR